MKTRAWMMMAVLASSAAVTARQPASEAATSAATPAPQRATKTSFSITSPEARQILRAAAADSDPQHATGSPTDSLQDDQPSRLGMPPLRFRAPRGVHHMDCESTICTAYNAEDTVLYTVSRDEAFSIRSPNASGGYDSWLSCQSTNNLLSTFERYDKCRGIQIFVPTGDRNILLALPRLNVK